MDPGSAKSLCSSAPNKRHKSTSKTSTPKYGVARGARQRKNRSEVWDYFEKLEEGTYIQPRGDDYKRGICKGCETLIICDSRYGTTNLRRHMKSCLKLKEEFGMKQILLDAPIFDDVPLSSSEIDDSVYRELIAKMIVRHDLPLSLVEYDGFRDVQTSLNRNAEHITASTCRAHMFKLYREGKVKVKDILSLCPGRISLTTSFWGTVTGDTYMCVTANFVDKDWKLQKFVLCFSLFLPNDDGSLIMEKFTKLLGRSGWNIEHKLMAITLDSVTDDDTFMGHYMGKLLSQGVLLSKGRFFRVRCVSHVVNSIVEECLEELHDIIQKVRYSVKYVEGSPSRLLKLKEAVRDKKIPCVRELRHDVVTRWDSTYLMLESVLFYKGAFSHLAVIDGDYPYCPSPDEWNKVEVFCKFFKLYYDLISLVSGAEYPTSDVFFHRVWLIQYQLLEEAKNCDCILSAMVLKMLRKFDNYWEECNLILSAAVVLDPRYKMKVVEYVNMKIYGTVEGFTKAQSVRDFLLILFKEYKENSSSGLVPVGPSKLQHELSISKLNPSDIYPDEFDRYRIDKNFAEEKTELDKYLQDPLLDRKQDLDVLNWWKLAECCYPCLAKLARDVLSISMTSVASKSAFSVGGRTLEPSRCSLSAECLEAVICTKDWIFGLKEEDQGHVDSATEALLSLNLNATSQVA